MLILLLSGLLAAFLIQKLVYRKNWEKGLSVKVAFQDSWVYEGEEGILKEIVTNNKLLPVPALEIGIAMSRNLRFDKESEANSSVTDQSYKRDMFSFLFYQQITRSLSFKAEKRGFYEIHQARVNGWDFLFANSFYKEYPQHTQLYVYPRQTDVTGIQMICRTLSGMVMSRNRLYEDPFEFAGIREYRREDPMNRINWKTSAREGKLMVNQYDATTSIRVTLLMDMEDRNILREEEVTEESIRIVSSLGTRLVKEKMEVHIKSNGKDQETGEALDIFLPAGAGRCARLNQKLACLKNDQWIYGGSELVREEIKKLRTGCTYILISKNQTEEMYQAVNELSSGNNQLLWVVPYLPGKEIPKGRGRGFQIMGWEVHV